MIKDMSFKIVSRYLNRIDQGTLIVELPDGRVVRYGSGEKQARMIVKYMRLFKRIIRFGDIGFAESYMDGDFSSPDLAELLYLLAASVDAIGGSRGFTPGILGFLAPINYLGHKLSPNSRKGSRKNIRAHYDLPPDFFSTFLDDTMMYSAACYPGKEMNAKDAQLTKLDSLIEKMDLHPGMNVLEIGSGWGEMACRMAETKNVNVTTITLSREQKKYTEEKIKARGLEDSVAVMLIDYRDMEGQFDAIVSVEMIEAVGLRYMNLFFKKCNELLRSGGRLVLQAITIPDRYFEYYTKKTDFIQKYIFPGGMLPSVSLLMNMASKKNDFDLIQYADEPDDYTLTLRQWRSNFENNLQKIINMGFDAKFCRMWSYYLSYCEAGFATRNIRLARLVMKKPGPVIHTASKAIWPDYTSSNDFGNIPEEATIF